MSRTGTVAFRTPAILAFVLSFLVAGCSGPGSPLIGVTRSDPLLVGSVSLPDVTETSLRAGGVVERDVLTFSAAPGRLLLVYFGFTHCPDVCPATLADLRVALRDVEDSARVDLAFVTVDPDRDTAEVLNGYLPYFAERFHVLRGTDAQISEAAAAFLVSYEVRKEAGGVVDVAHTAVLYAVDSGGKVVVEWPFGTRSPTLAADLNTILKGL